jgi:hypothetical protein
MLSVILLALIGNQVFPEFTGWWIAYAVVVCGLKTLVFVIQTAKALLKD